MPLYPQGMQAQDWEYRECRRQNPDAPSELSLFAFLLGSWCGEATLKRDGGSWESFDAGWEGRFILDGYIIADEFRMAAKTGELLVLGMNFRTYDPARKAWNMRWLNALGGTWTDLAPESLGGVSVAGDSVSYCMSEPVAGHAFTRATYCTFGPNRFTWSGERSADLCSWERFLFIDLRRRG